MAGTFSKAGRPKRPGAYFNFQVKSQEVQLENSLGTVALFFTHSWGPGETVVELRSFADFLAYFGRGSQDPAVFTEGYKAVQQAFQGEGVDGRGGAGRVLAFRAEGASAAKASRTVSNTTPATALTLTALYNGSYGQQVSYTIGPDSVDTSTHDNFVIYVEGAEVERYKYAKTNITDLVAQINGTTPYSAITKSDWVSATQQITGVALTVSGTQTALTGGDDGATMLAADYTAWMAAVEPFRFSLLAAANLTDTTIQASIKTWSQNLNAKGKRFMTVIGGLAAETFTTAAGSSGGASQFNDPNFVRLGMGTYTHSRFGDLTTAQLAPRIAGIFAWRGEALGITYARLADLTIKVGASDSDLSKAVDAGVIGIARDSHPTAPVRLETAVTTYTTASSAAVPVSIFGNPKFVRTMHGIETELTEFAETQVIGLLPVNDGTRDYVRGQMAARLQAREDAAVIQPNWKVTIAVDPAPSDNDTFVALDYSIAFGRDLQQILNTVVVG